MQKNGHCNIRQAAQVIQKRAIGRAPQYQFENPNLISFQDKREKYMSDFFTTFVDLDWLYSVELVSNITIQDLSTIFSNRPSSTCPLNRVLRIQKLQTGIRKNSLSALFISFYAITWVIFSFLYWSVAKFRGDIGIRFQPIDIKEI